MSRSMVLGVFLLAVLLAAFGLLAYRTLLAAYIAVGAYVVTRRYLQ